MYFHWINNFSRFHNMQDLKNIGVTEPQKGPAKITNKYY